MAVVLAGIFLVLPLSASYGQNSRPTQVLSAAEIDYAPPKTKSGNNLCCGTYIPRPQPTETLGTVVNGSSLEGNIGGDFTIEDGIEVIHLDTWLNARRGTYDPDEQTLTLEDSVEIRRQGLYMRGERALFNRKTNSSSLSTASYVLHDSELRGEASVVTYTDHDGIITINNGLFTRCEPGTNSWQIIGSEIVLNQRSKQGVAKNMRLEIEGVPVFYFPHLSFPLTSERMSGFLIPVLGNTQRGGFDVEVPYYLNLSPNYDLTLKPRLQSKRGVSLGAEARYLGKRHEQILDLNFLPQDKLFNPALVNTPGNDSPPLSSRWMIDYEMGARLDKGWSLNANFTGVSDNEYFQDFGSQGLVSTTNSFLRRQTTLRYRSRNLDFKALAQGFQLIDPSVSAVSQPYLRLPSLSLDGEWTQELTSGWYLDYGFDSEWTHFSRSLDDNLLSPELIQRGAQMSAQRSTFSPYVQLNWENSYAYLRPRLGLAAGNWQLQDQAIGTPDSFSRSIMSSSVDAGLIFEREMGDLFDQDLTQTLEPRLYYLYNSYEDQSQFPLLDSSYLTFSYSQLFRPNRFSGEDRIGDANQLTLALSSSIYGAKGRELVSMSLGQIHYFDPPKVGLRDELQIESSTRESALAGQLNVYLNGNWRLNNYLEWDTNNSAVNVASFQFQYQSAINQLVNFGYRYRELPGPDLLNGLNRRIDQIDLAAIWPLSPTLGLIARFNQDLANQRSLESIAGVEYSNCCWKVRLLAREWIDNNSLFLFGTQETNRGLFLQFELKGLGSVIGGSVEGLLDNGIRGFRTNDFSQ